MKTQKFYITGKMTGFDRIILLTNFYNAQKVIQEKYATTNIINPIDLCSCRWSWLRCMIVCLCHLIFKADTVVLMSDWCDSKSAKIEVLTALVLRKKIILL